MEFKVGDRIRVFEITEQGSKFYENKKIKGLQRPCILPEFSQFGVDIFTRDLTGDDFHFGIDERAEAKHVATMVITKLKATT